MDLSLLKFQFLKPSQGHINAQSMRNALIHLIALDHLGSLRLLK